MNAMARSTGMGIGVLGLVALSWSVSGSAARADNIDAELLTASKKVMKDIQDRGYKNVGILKFRVVRGDKPSSFNVGLLNGNMATRLEYALVLVNDDKNPIGITRDASHVIAAKDKQATYLKAADRPAMFKHTFPLAWGNDKVSVDCFLAGQVKISPDMKKTTVVIEAFDRKTNALREVVNFTVPTDRSILADSGESFSLVKRGPDSLKRRAEELDDDATKNANDRNKGKKIVEKDAVDNLIDLDVHYNDQKVEVTRDDKGQASIAEPQENQQVHFVIRNKSAERLAVVIRVNGINTLCKEGADKQVDQCIKWVLEPNKQYAIRGFYLEDGKTVEKFKVVAPDTLSDLSPDKLGLIEVDVFRESGNSDEELLRTRKISLRGLKPGTARPATFAALKANVFQTMTVKKKPIIYAGDQEQAVVKETDFKGPTHTGSLVIRYYQPGQVKEEPKQDPKEKPKDDPKQDPKQ
ncbi:MAG: hypothetical protein K2R98_12685 [Gemmataceae bacterium]|nr:hypothetical protein [Gemmataceae bacterium]